MTLEQSLILSYNIALKQASEETLRNFAFFLDQETFFSIDSEANIDEIYFELKKLSDHGEYILAEFLAKLVDLIGQEK